MKSADSLSVIEIRNGFLLALVFFLRMLGLFMLIPVIALIADEFPQASLLKIGLALSVYGLTQALFQIPLGMLSDKYGRRPVIVLGLMIFAVGSILASLAGSIEQIIIGRVLQGSGAIASSVMALAADLSREEQRTKIMAMIGFGIGMAFILAFLIGPVLYSQIGYRGMFLLCAMLAVLAISILLAWVPNPQRVTHHYDVQSGLDKIRQICGDKLLSRLNISVFFLHLILMANFTVLPLILRDTMRLEVALHWQFYLPVLMVSLLFVMPLLLWVERAGKARFVLLGMVTLLFLTQCVIGLSGAHYFLLLVFVTLFFTTFNYLEAFLPAQVSRNALAEAKGTALGLYSSAQFMGIFFGGLLGGSLHGMLGLAAVYPGCALLALLWLIIMFPMPSFGRCYSYTLQLDELLEQDPSELVGRLCDIKGVIDATILVKENTIRLKVNADRFDRGALDMFLSQRQLD